jgi:hypothetical protein
MQRLVRMVSISPMLLLVACATGSPAPDPVALPGAAQRDVMDGGSSQSSDLAEAPPCLPPGVRAEFFTWPVQAFRALALKRDDDTIVAGAWVLYGKGGHRVVALWGGDDLSAVDPDPLANAPVWIDTGRINDDLGTLRAEARACRWRRTGGVEV